MIAPAQLWNDPSVYRRKPEKAAAALLSVGLALERHRPLGGAEDEFLDLLRRMRAADPEHFGRVWYAPAAYRWAHLAYELVGAVLSPGPLPVALADYCADIGKPEPRAALAFHLDEAKRFALSLGLVSATAVRFAHPFVLDLPAPLPGTPFHIAGTGRLAVDGFADGRVIASRVSASRGSASRGSASEVSASRESASGVIASTEATLARALDVECAGYSLSLHPQAFHLPGLRLGRELLEIPATFQAEQAPVVAAALEHVRRHAPDTFAQLRHIVALTTVKPPTLSDFSNQTHSELPGTFLLSACPDPLGLADSIVHELHHNRLFALEEDGAFLHDDDRASDTHYSPWRDDLRPLHGLLHGLYVYLALFRFWAAAYRSGELSAAHADLARDTLLRTALQARLAVTQLERFARFTAFGRELFDSLARDVAELPSAVAALGLPDDLPAFTLSEAGAVTRQVGRRDGRPLSVCAAVIEHAEHCDPNEECRDLLAQIASPAGARARAATTSSSPASS